MDILIFSTADWDNPFWTNKQHMAKTFEANGHRVIYVDSLGLRKPTGSSKDLKRIFKRLFSLFKPYSKVSDNIWRVRPFVIPLHSNKFIGLLNKWLLKLTLAIVKKSLRFSSHLIWTYSPVSVDVIKNLKNHNVVYHCVDDLRAVPGIDSELIETKEKELCSLAVTVFTTSQALYQRLKVLNENTFYHNNVCDYEHFSMAKQNFLDEPEELKDINRPTILFIGAISNYKLNTDLIEYIAKKRPRWNWVMIGQVGEGEPGSDVNNLHSHKNIHFLGPKPYSQLPSYIKYSDVCVIPAILNKYTESMFPMKFFEYLSAGKQVVSTDLSSLKSYDECFFSAKNFKEFEEALEKILVFGDAKNSNLIESVCVKQTWQHRYEEMMAILDSNR